MQDEPIRYSRSQCARLFGISMDTLRYYERIGLLHVARDKRSRQCVYTEHEIMRLLDFRKIKSLGFSNDELLGTFNRTDGLSHLKVFDESLEKLHTGGRTARADAPCPRHEGHFSDDFRQAGRGAHRRTAGAALSAL